MNYYWIVFLAITEGYNILQSRAILLVALSINANLVSFLGVCFAVGGKIMKTVLEIFQFCFQFFIRKKISINENVSFTVHASRIQLLDCSKLAINRKNDNYVTFAKMTPSSIFFNVVLFLMSILVTSPTFMSIPLLVLELRQFSFIRD